MHSPLPLAYAGKDAVHIFIFLLVILAGAFLDENLARLAEIAGFIFIRNRHGNNVEFHEVGLEVAGSAHVEHFEKPLLRNVQTILGTTLALCNPNGTLAGNNFGTNEFGQNLGRQIDFTRGNAADDGNHAVGPQQRLHHPVCEQVVPYADFGQRHIVEHQHPLRKRRIQDDVPVIGDGEEFSVYLMQISNPLVGKTGRGTPDDDIDGLGDHRVLKIVHPIDIQQHIFKGADREFGENVFAYYRKCRMAGKFMHCGYHLFVAVWLDVF